MSRSPEHQALSAAAHWFARMGATPGDATVLRLWQAWLDENPLHQWAWQRVAMLQTQLGDAKGALGYQVLGQMGSAAGPRRRVLLKSLALGLGIGALGCAGYRQAPPVWADLRTGTGERLTRRLADGSTLVLNTASAVDIVFSPGSRLIRLREGEVFIETANDPRPFIVRSAQGDLQALGTRFSVRQQESLTQLRVFQHAVAVRPVSASTGQTVVDSGQAVSFDTRAVFDRQALDPSADAWISGWLVVDGWRLDRLIEELQRYRLGYLGCAPEIAYFRVSGAYPLDDIDLALAAIARSVPAKVVRYTGLWTRLVSKAASA